MLRLGAVVIVLCCTSLVAACGGGGGGGGGSGGDGLLIDPPPTEPNTSQLASGLYENTGGIDPLPSFRAVTLPSSSRFEYRRDVPAGSPGITIVRYIAPGTTVPDDLIAMAYRAAELWTRRIESIRGHDSPYFHLELSEDRVLEVDLVVGFPEVDCGAGADACATHYADPGTDPPPPALTPTVTTPPSCSRRDM